MDCSICRNCLALLVTVTEFERFGLHLPHTQHAHVHALDIEILSQATLFNCCWVFGEFKV